MSMAITDQLADALRALHANTRPLASPEGELFHKSWHDAGAILAAYDAQQATRRTIYTLETLAETLAQIVHFAHDDYSEESGSVVLPEPARWTVAYIVACFTAQHTINGDNGVGTEEGLKGLCVDQRMTYAQRLEKAREHVATWGGPHNRSN